MDIEKPLTINVRLEVEVLSGDFSGFYLSRLVHRDSGRLLIVHPVHQGALVPVSPGQELVIRFLNDGGVFEFHTEVISLQPEKTPVLPVTTPSTLTKIQRRAHVRVPVSFELDFHVLGPDGHHPAPGAKPHHGLAVDLSGGGLSIHHDASLTMDQRILFDLVLPRYTLKNIIGRVMRAQDYTPPSKLAREAGVEFSAIREKDREQVIRYVFERQIALKKKA